MNVLSKQVTDSNALTAGNQLFPVFLKLNKLKVLLVGAGNVGLEKLSALLVNSPEAEVTIVAERFLPEVADLVRQHAQVKANYRKFEANDLEDQDLVVIATGDNILNSEIRSLARKKHLLINVADKPELCDFYLGSIVKKGDLKIGISTNGKSPTIAKRLKEVFQECLPEELDTTLQQMNQLRNTLKGDFAYKVNELNRATAVLVASDAKPNSRDKMRWMLWGVALGVIITLALYSAFSILVNLYK